MSYAFECIEYGRIKSQQHVEESDPVMAMRAPEWGPMSMQQPMMPVQGHWGTPAHWGTPSALPMHPNVYLPGPMRSNGPSWPSQQAAVMSAARPVQNHPNFHEDRAKWAKKSNASGQLDDAPISGVLCYSVPSKKTMIRLGVSGSRMVVLRNVSYASSMSRMNNCEKRCGSDWSRIGRRNTKRRY